MISWVRVYFVLFSILLFVDLRGCDDSQQSKTTYVSHLEKFVLDLEHAGSSLSGIVSHIPVLGHIYKDESGKSNSTISNVFNRHKIQIKAIFPGTYWCGDGDKSPNGEDVGYFNNTDTCCKKHDSCNNSIAAGETKYGLENNGAFTRSHCSCDQEFYDCLKKVKSIVATDIGTTYFNVLKPQCFKSDYPIIGCKTHSGLLLDRKCTEYNLNTTQPKEVQWFDNPDFIRI